MDRTILAIIIISVALLCSCCVAASTDSPVLKLSGQDSSESCDLVDGHIEKFQNDDISLESDFVFSEISDKLSDGMLDIYD